MSLSHCSKCWDTPCLCGHNYRHLSINEIKDLIKNLEKILEDKESRLIDKNQREFISIFYKG